MSLAGLSGHPGHQGPGARLCPQCIQPAISTARPPPCCSPGVLPALESGPGHKITLCAGQREAGSLAARPSTSACFIRNPRAHPPWSTGCLAPRPFPTPPRGAPPGAARTAHRTPGPQGHCLPLALAGNLGPVWVLLLTRAQGRAGPQMVPWRPRLRRRRPGSPCGCARPRPPSASGTGWACAPPPPPGRAAGVGL